MFCFLLQSCGSHKETVKTSNTNISGNWSLKSLNGQNTETLFEGKHPSLNIDQSRCLISGIGGCNNFSGQFSFEKGIFETSSLTQTLMMCTNKNAEPQLMEAIGGKSTVYIENDLLTFVKDGKIVALFEKGIDNALLSGEWILKTIGKRPASDFFTDDIPTMIFVSAEKKIFGSSGCNEYNTNYSLNGFSLNVGTIITTRMACSSSSGETQFIQAISDDSTITLDEDTLTFYKNKKETLQFVKEQE